MKKAALARVIFVLIVIIVTFSFASVSASRPPKALYANSCGVSKILWIHRASPEVAEDFVIDDTSIYLGRGGGYRPGVLYCLDRKIGKTRWQRFISPPTKKYAIFPPVLYKDIVYIAVASGKICAVEKKTGRILWSHQLKSIVTPLAVDEDSIYAAERENYLFALNRIDRSTKWKYWTKYNRPGCKPVLHGDTVYFGCGHIIYALSKATGKEKWKTTVGDFIWGVVCWKGKLYVTSSGRGLVVLDERTGKEIWSYYIADEPSPPILAQGVIYFGSTYRRSWEHPYDSPFYAINATNGKLVWQSFGCPSVGSAPAFHRGTLVMGSSDGNIYGVLAKDGGVLWKFRVGDEIVTTPVIKGDCIYFGSFEGSFYALKAKI